jgi:pilus assembly protein FimV
LASRALISMLRVSIVYRFSQIKSMVVKRADVDIFELHTDQQLDEPLLHLLLQIEWPGGRLVREIPALIDPPYKISSKAAPAEAPRYLYPNLLSLNSRCSRRSLLSRLLKFLRPKPR